MSAAPGATVGSRSARHAARRRTAAADTAIAATFGNPFVSLGWTSVVDLQRRACRARTRSTRCRSRCSATLTTYAEAARPLTLDSPAGLPTTIQIDATRYSDGRWSCSIHEAGRRSATLDRPYGTRSTWRRYRARRSGDDGVHQASRSDVVGTGPSSSFRRRCFAGHMYSSASSATRAASRLRRGDLRGQLPDLGRLPSTAASSR